MSGFCKSHFFSKNISVNAIFNDQNFNETLTNGIVSFEQLGPGDASKTTGEIENNAYYSDVALYKRTFHYFMIVLLCLNLQIKTKEKECTFSYMLLMLFTR